MSRTAPMAWLALIAVDVAFEGIALKTNRTDCTLSHATRTICKTDSKSGKVAFVLAWGALSTWFVPHVLKGSE